LRCEGIARELINRIQNLRKDSGFDVTDKITVTLQRHPALAAAMTSFKDFIASQTLAVAVELTDEVSGGVAIEIDEMALQVAVKKVSVKG
jgi:isoleucyl-tRNA synthetase